MFISSGCYDRTTPRKLKNYNMVCEEELALPPTRWWQQDAVGVKTYQLDLGCRRQHQGLCRGGPETGSYVPQLHAGEWAPVAQTYRQTVRKGTISILRYNKNQQSFCRFNQLQFKTLGLLWLKTSLGPVSPEKCTNFVQVTNNKLAFS